jgi:AraC-like DNA-binding protein
MIDTTTTSFGLASWCGTPASMPIAHCHNDLELNYLLEGRVFYRFGGAQIELQAGDFCLFWAARPHQLWVRDGAPRMYWITLPLGLFLRWQLPRHLSGPILNGQPLTYQQLPTAPGYLHWFAQWANDLAFQEPERHAIVCLELEAFLRRLALVLTEEEGSQLPVAELRQGHAEQMARFIALHYTEPLSIGTIAAHVGLHPHYAMELFRKAYGVSLITYLTQYRVAHAQQLLVTTDTSVLEIGMAAGFASASRFYSSFKAICGMAPGAYRATLLGQR